MNIRRFRSGETANPGGGAGVVPPPATAAVLWPEAWNPVSFSLMSPANTRTFDGYYPGMSQAIDLMGEYWRCSLALVDGALDEADAAMGAELEAFIDHLRGRAGLVQIWNLRFPQPRGTLRGSPTLYAEAGQLATTITLQTLPGKTLEVGDCIGFGGQVSRCQTRGVANAAGQLTVRIWPRVRSLQPAGTAVQWDKPLITFRQASADSAALQWGEGGAYAGPTFEFVEA